MLKRNLLVLAFLVSLAGCELVKPPIDECAHYPTQLEQGYCYVSKEVTAARLSTAQSYRDGVITYEQALKVRNALVRADATLDLVEQMIDQGNTQGAAAELVTAKQILLELSK